MVDSIYTWIESLPPVVWLVCLSVTLVALVWSVTRVRIAREKEQAARQEAIEARHIKNDFVAMVSHELW
ncbi:MAG: hypothetical protein WD064_02350, partial [Acidimicrobiia bacterium]